MQEIPKQHVNIQHTSSNLLLDWNTYLFYTLAYSFYEKVHTETKHCWLAIFY